ncbi:hypothetical protein SmJEL517_g01822 [Synchytrium microbalum]|uniref:Uncharacterized protein n=1 Tax=Synchytrium microbalum TaxID=1806994 RepID=A0A507C4J3_9FUNG|nr:uncharacterized protein SmJEL517_g01822 [Synchytrium microbalum]TPX35897.1 hypothetical protein SmJEL517_g01822 [Synchytrium microbalum]
MADFDDLFLNSRSATPTGSMVLPLPPSTINSTNMATPLKTTPNGSPAFQLTSSPATSRKSSGGQGQHTNSNQDGINLLEPPDAKTQPSQFVLHNLYARFMLEADTKMNALLYLQLASDRDVDLSMALRAGQDLSFDRLLQALGSMAKHCPKVVIDSISLWRRNKGEFSSKETNVNISSLYPSLRGKDMEGVLKERKMYIANFILCRALMEVVKNLTEQTLTSELADQLEDMCFTHLQKADPDQVIKAANRQANIDAFSSLVGCISGLKFASVSDRYVLELRKFDKGLIKENKLEMIIRCMRYLQLKIYPMDALEETAEFLQTCAEIFSTTHSQKIKHAFSDVFVELLEPVAAIATAEVNLPAWMKTIETIFPKASRMITKQRHLEEALPLITTLLCVSKRDFFHKNWGSFAELCVSKFRDKNSKSIAITSLIRLLWVYVNRHSETSAATALRRIDLIAQALFPRNRRGVIPESINLDHFVQFVYIVCVKHLDHGIETLILPLMGLEHLMPAQSVGTATPTASSTVGTVSTTVSSTTPSSSNTVASMTMSSVASGLSSGLAGNVATVTIPEEAGLTSFTMSSAPAAPSIVIGDAAVNPERMIVGLRSLLLILADIEDALASTSTSMPTTSGMVIVEGRYTIPQPPFAIRSIVGSGLSLDSLMKLRERPNRTNAAIDINAPLPERMTQRMGAVVREAVERVNDVLGKVAVALDGAVGWALVIDVIPLSNLPRESNTAATNQNHPTRRASFSGETLTNLPERTLLQPDPPQNPFGRDRQVLFDLMRAYIDCIPRLVPAGVSPRRLVEMLCRYALHADDGVRVASVRALKRVASLRDDAARKKWNLGDEFEGLAGGIVRIAADVSIGIVTDRFADVMAAMSYDGGEAIIGGTLGLYVELLDLWLQEVEREKRVWPAREVAAVVEEIEARGLFYLCSTSPAIRRQALKVLTLAEEFDFKFQSLKKSECPTTAASPVPGSATHRSAHTAAALKTKRRASQMPVLNPSSSRLNRILEEYGPELVRRHYHDPVLASSTRSEQTKLAAQQRREHTGDSLRHFIGSDNPEDAVVWTRCYPDLICRFFEFAAPKALQICLKDASARLVALHPPVAVAAETPGNRPLTTAARYGAAATERKGAIAATEDMMEQWRLYLVFFCANHEVGKIAALSPPDAITMNAANKQEMSRTRSDPSLYPSKASNLTSSTNSLNTPSVISAVSTATTTTTNTAIAASIAAPIITASANKHSNNASLKHILALVLPLLSCERVMVRQGIVAALGCLNYRSYKELLEDLQPYMKQVIDDMRSRLAAPTAQRKNSNATGNQYKRMERLRMELTHLLGLVANFAEHHSYRYSEAMMGSVLMFVSECMKFLSDSEVQSEWEHQMLRYYFAGLLDRLYNQLVTAVEKKEGGGVSITVTNNNSNVKRSGSTEFPETVEHHMPFEMRLALFRLLEGWCGYGQFAGPTRDREARMMQAVLDQVKDIRERGALTSTMEEQRKALEIAALKAMAALCRGPIVATSTSTGSTGPETFDLTSFTSWIDSLLSSPDEKVQIIARAALSALLDNNRQAERLVEHIVKQCYEGLPSSNVTSGYFGVLAEVYSRSNPTRPSEEQPRRNVARILCLALYKAADSNPLVRRGAIQLLRALDNMLKAQQVQTGSGSTSSSSVDIAMVDAHETYEEAAMTSALPAIYKYAQAGVSARLAQEYPDLTFEMLSEMVQRVELLSAIIQAAQTTTVSSASSIATTYIYRQGIHDILVYMVPWVRNIALVSSTSEEGGDNSLQSSLHSQPSTLTRPISPSDVVLTNLFALTIKYADDYVTELEDIWVQLVERSEPEPESLDGEDPIARLKKRQERVQREEVMLAVCERNIQIVIDFLLQVGVQRRNPKFVNYAKKVVVYLGRTSACSQLIDFIMARIQPKGLVPSGANNVAILAAEKVPEVEFEGFGSERAAKQRSKSKLGGILGPSSPSSDLYVVDLEQVLIDMPKRPAFSKGQLACVLLVDLSIEYGDVLRSYLPLLLHVIFVQLDHFIAIICEQSRLLLLNLIRSILSPSIDSTDTGEIVGMLGRDNKRLWTYEDITQLKRVLESTEQLSTLCLEVVELFSPVYINLAQQWGEIALVWGTSCPVRHVACRSLQLFRTLRPSFGSRMLGDVLGRLAVTVGDSTEEIQGFALEILATLHSMCDSLESQQLAVFPQFFWAASACLYSPHECEFVEGVGLLHKIIDKVDLHDDGIRRLLSASLPNRWRGPFTGIQPLLMNGLYSAESEAVALNVINSLLGIDDDSLIDTGNARVLNSILANLPRMLQSLEIDPKTNTHSHSAANNSSNSRTEAAMINITDTLRIAAELSSLAERKGYAPLARLLTSYSLRKFRSKEDFLRQLCVIIRDSFFPTHDRATLRVLIGQLSNRLTFYRRRTLKTIHVLFATLDVVRRVELVTFGDDGLLQPLLALLQTDLAVDTLEVLDEILPGFLMAGEGNQRIMTDVLMAQKTGAASALNAHRKEVKEGTGWRVRDVTAAVKQARYNIGGVSSTCAGMENSPMSRSKSGYKAFNVGGGGNNGGMSGESSAQPSPIVKNNVPFAFLGGNVLAALDDLDAFWQDQKGDEMLASAGSIMSSMLNNNNGGNAASNRLSNNGNMVASPTQMTSMGTRQNSLQSVAVSMTSLATDISSMDPNNSNSGSGGNNGLLDEASLFDLFVEGYDQDREEDDETSTAPAGFGATDNLAYLDSGLNLIVGVLHGEQQLLVPLLEDDGLGEEATESSGALNNSARSLNSVSSAGNASPKQAGSKAGSVKSVASASASPKASPRNSVEGLNVEKTRKTIP